MEIRRLWLSQFKGIQASFEPRSIVVLFGKNNAGKSNILEAIQSALGWEEAWRKDPVEDVQDRPRLCTCASPVQDDLLRHLLWTKHKHDFEGEEEEDWPLDELLDLHRRHVIRKANPSHFFNGDQEGNQEQLWNRAQKDFTRLLDRYLGSRWLGFSLGEITWCPPTLNECHEEDRAAAARLLELRGDFPEGVIPALDSFAISLAKGILTSVDDPNHYPKVDDEVWIWDFPDKAPPYWEVVRISADAPSLGRVAEELAKTVSEIQLLRQETPPPLLSLENSETPYSAELWLEKGPADWVRVRRDIQRICREISWDATRIAPRFVTLDHVIEIQPLSPIDWHGGRRLRLMLRPRSATRGFDLTVIGSGLAVWAAHSIEEAARRLRRKTMEQATSDRGRASTVLFIDEPERHLHPDAQREVAAWLSLEVTGGTTVFLATHAAPFLNLPIEDVQYVLVSRSPEGTQAEVVTEDVLGTLKRRADEVGMSLPELAQVARAVLLVEGAHDEAVINHFYRSDLSRHRIEIMPIRGVKEALALADLQFLVRHRYVLIGLFDTVTSVFLEDLTLKPLGLEEKMVRELRQCSDDIRFVPFDEPDIFCAIPDAAVAATLQSYWEIPDFPGWDSLKVDYAKGGNGKFKEFVCKSLGIRKKGVESWRLHDRLLEQMLHTMSERFPNSGPRRSLDRAMHRVFAESAAKTSGPPVRLGR